MLRFKHWHRSDMDLQKYARLSPTSREDFTERMQEMSQFGWGGQYWKPEVALEGAFYLFVRCNGRKPIDTGAIWIGTRYDFPLIYVDNSVANWICPYTRTGRVMTEPFEPIHRVIENWARLSNRKLYPSLNLQPLPG